jgi:SAM-dependent methyltransferase
MPARPGEPPVANPLAPAPARRSCWRPQSERIAVDRDQAPPTEYDAAMAAAYLRGRTLRPADVTAWMTAARPHLPTGAGRVLDLGAGTGRFTAALAGACPAAVVACEPSAAMRAACRANCPPGVEVVGGTAEAMPFAAGAFDAVWASQVVHHVPDLPAFARGTRRVLRPGGSLVLRGGFGATADLPLHHYFPDAWSGGSVHPTLDRITEVLGGAGLRPVHREAVGQTFAAGPDELLDRVRTRSLSTLAALPDVVFRAGLLRLASDVGEMNFPVVERLDLVVFRCSGACVA